MKINLSVNEINYLVDMEDYPAEATLNYFIRTCLQLHGTKFMCNEGGCGCCNVTAKIYDPYSKCYKICVINSCLRLLCTCDGCEITTIENIGNKKTGYHPIQKALVDSNGTQCGYCSPGMIMTMYSLLKSTTSSLTREKIENSFDGNICRCTGYRPILDAMKSFASDNENITDIEELSLQCCKLKVSEKENLKENYGFVFLDMESKEHKCKDDFLNCHLMKIRPAYSYNDNIIWYRPNNFCDLFKILKSDLLNNSNFLLDERKYYLICAGTGHGVFRRPDNISILIDLNKMNELFVREICSNQIDIGANISIADVLDMMLIVSEQSGFEYCSEIFKHWSLVATVAIRNVAGLAGNLMLKHDHKEFPSDIFVVLEALNATITIMEDFQNITHCKPLEFLSIDMHKKLITKIMLPSYEKINHIFKSYKVMMRTQNSVALLNAAFLLRVEKSSIQLRVLEARLCFGNISANFVHAIETENFMLNKDLLEQNIVEQILTKLHDEIYPDVGFDNISQEYRRTVACSILYKFFLEIIPSKMVSMENLSGKTFLQREVSFGNQTTPTNSDTYPVGYPINKVEAKSQCSGEAFYTNDLQTFNNELWASYVRATHVGSTLVEISTAKALTMPGVVAFFGAKDIPGINSFVLKGDFPFFVEDEPVFLEINGTVRFYDQPVGILVGYDRYSLYKAIKKVKLTYQNYNLTKPYLLFSLNDIKTKYQLLERTASSVTKKISIQTKNSSLNATKNIRSNFSINGQYHCTIEPQTTISLPTESGITVFCANQFCDLHHIVLEKFLNIPQKNIYVETIRIGGGYGAKFSRSAQVACAASLACIKLNRPIRFILSIEEMMRTIGKRCPLNCEYSVDADISDGRISNLFIEFFSNLGWNANESPMIPYTIPSITNCYNQFQSWNINGNESTTDTASNTWCRAPGSFEGIAMIETVMDNISFELGLDPVNVRLANMADDNKMKILLPQFIQSIDYKNRKRGIEQFNKENRWMKKGIGISVMQFGVIFYGPQIVYLAIYHGDGTVNICHGGVEMGQGLNTKVIQVAAYELGIQMENISLRPVNTFNTANNGFTAGSYTSETVCAAVKKACETIKERLKPIRDILNDSSTSWLKLIQTAYAQNVSLNVIQSASASDMQSYSVYGLACSEVLVDMLTGTVQVKRVDITEDTGKSLNPKIDIGQIEGAFIMGLGLWLTEKLKYNKTTGEILTDRIFNYKVPLATDIPIEFNINLLQNSLQPVGFMRSKTTGEPAVCLAISALFAIRHALISARKDSGINEWVSLGATTTPEEILIKSETNVSQFHLK